MLIITMLLITDTNLYFIYSLENRTHDHVAHLEEVADFTAKGQKTEIISLFSKCS